MNSLSFNVQLQYINHLLLFPIMMALCLLSVIYYAQNYAGIIGWSLVGGQAVVLVFIYILIHLVLNTIDHDWDNVSKVVGSSIDDILFFIIIIPHNEYC